MGTFGGHALPGTFFIVFAVWWTVQTYRRYFRSLSKGGQPYRSSVTFPFDCLCGRVRTWPWEGILKIFFTTIGFAGEIITAFKDGRFTHLGNGQHATMFFFFGLSGVVDVLVHFRFPLPKDIDYIISTLAFVVEDVLFMFHTHGRTSMDVLIHTLLVYVIHANVLVCLVELKFRNNVTVTLARSYVVFLQGTWFWQAGFILYNPIPGAQKWNEEDHEQMMVVTMMFAWHMAAIFIIMITIGLVVSMTEARCAERSKCGGVIGRSGDSNGSGRYDRIRLMDAEGKGSGSAEGETALLGNDSDNYDSDDVTFQRPTGGSVA